VHAAGAQGRSEFWCISRLASRLWARWAALVKTRLWDYPNSRFSYLSVFELDCTTRCEDYASLAEKGIAAHTPELKMRASKKLGAFPRGEEPRAVIRRFPPRRFVFNPMDRRRG